MKTYLHQRTPSNVLVLSVVVFFFMSGCEKDDGNLEGLSHKPSNTKIEGFIESLSAVDPKMRIPMIENFELQNNIDLTDHPAINEKMTANSNEATKIAPIVPEFRKVGGSSDSSGSDVSWIVVENYFGWWRVNSYETVRYYNNQMSNITHKYSALVGTTFDLVDWEEKYARGSINYASAIMKIEGILSVDGIGTLGIDNYCTVSVGSDSSLYRSSFR